VQKNDSELNAVPKSSSFRVIPWSR
jgi:hypothetical protein